MLLATWKTERFHVPARRNAKLEKWRPFGQSSPDVFDWICMYAYADFTGGFFPLWPYMDRPFGQSSPDRPR
jgi:hypothetical protein